MPQPLAKFFPINKIGSPCTTQTSPIVVPPMFAAVSDAKSSENHFDQDHAAELQEWLSLVALESPRVRADDSIDSHLSRYQVPNEAGTYASSLVRVRWHGFVTAKWAMGLWIQCL